MRILVVSDIHSNLQAIRAVLSQVTDHDAIWSLGDTVGYGANPNECIDVLVDAGVDPALVGNHDLAAVGLLPIGWFNVYAAQAAGWTTMQLTEEHRFRIRSSFTSTSVGPFLLVHGSPADPARDYVQTLADAVASLGAVAAQFILCGHTHVPMLAKMVPEKGSALVKIEPNVSYSLSGRRALLNPGSVGQPRDGDSRAAAMVIDTAEQTATWVRVPYDIDGAQRAIVSAGLPRELATRLARGR